MGAPSRLLMRRGWALRPAGAHLCRKILRGVEGAAAGGRRHSGCKRRRFTGRARSPPPPLPGKSRSALFGQSSFQQATPVMPLATIEASRCRLCSGGAVESMQRRVARAASEADVIGKGLRLLTAGVRVGAGPEFSREFERASLMGPAALHAFYRPGMNSPDAIPLEVVRCPPPPLPPDEGADAHLF